MRIRHHLSDYQKQEIERLYLDNHSCIEIKEIMQLKQSVRTIQLHIHNKNLTRSDSDTYRLAIDKGRRVYKHNFNQVNRAFVSYKLRALVFRRDNYRCQLCGATAKDSLLQIDHKDEDKNNNKIGNLQVLCISCNLGKHYISNI